MPSPSFSGPRPAGGKDDRDRKEGATKTRQQIEDDGREQYFELRRSWSIYLMRALGISIAFQGFVVVLVGAGSLPFRGHEIFLNTVSGEIFLQIAGMCLIIVRCLFPSTKEKAKKKDSKKQPMGSKISGPRETSREKQQSVTDAGEEAPPEETDHVEQRGGAING